MIIALKSNPSKKYVAYGIYWGTGKGKFQRLHNIIEPEDGVGGFSIVVEDEVDIIDPSLDHYFMRKDSKGMDMLVHKVAYPSEEFYVDLIDCGALDKVELLLQNMRDMGLELK